MGFGGFASHRRGSVRVMEGRAMIEGVVGLWAKFSLIGIHVLLVTDNMSCARAFDTCRAHRHDLIRQLRLFFAIRCYLDVRPHVRCIPSVWNLADRDARLLRLIRLHVRRPMFPR